MNTGQSGIYRMSLTEVSLVNLNVSERVQISKPTSLVYDNMKNCLYWTDITLKKIRRFSLTDYSVDTMNLTSGKHYS